MRPQQLLAHSTEHLELLAEHRELPRIREVFRQTGPVERFGGLSRLIDAEIIPRLILAHRAEYNSATKISEPALSPNVINEFIRLVLMGDPATTIDYAEELRKSGVRTEALYLHLLTPAARQLGELWEADQASFVEVTLGIWLLQQVLRVLNPFFLDEHCSMHNGRRILLASAPGEQHSFGVVMLSEFFRREGWGVSGGPGLAIDDVLHLVHVESFETVGLSLSNEDRVEPLLSYVRRIRRASLNPAVNILVGGRAFIDHPEFVTGVNADATASDGREALAVADAFPSQREKLS